MSITVAIVEGPLPPQRLAAGPSGAGAVVAFEGIVRPLEDGHALASLDYEAYLPMAEHALHELAARVASEHGLLAVNVQHSRGRVPAHACSFRLVIYARHRKEALAATDNFIDRMKRDVPIWKRAVWAKDVATPQPDA